MISLRERLSPWLRPLPGVAACALLLAPLPLGLRTAELTVLALLGIGALLVLRQLGTARLFIPVTLFLIVSLGTAVAWGRGDAVVPFQFARAVVFPCLLLWLLYERMSDGFFENIERTLPFLVAGACLSLVLYFGLQSGLYNSTLDIPYDSAQYKRLYVYPTYLFLILLFDAVRGGRRFQFLYAAILIASGSKVLIACVVAIYAWFSLGRGSTRRALAFASGIVVLMVVAVLTGLLDRAFDLLYHGDPWRIREPIAAVTQLADPIRFLIGHGAGVAYWPGETALAEALGADARVFVNSMYDVHNGFVTLALRFGVPIAVVYFFALVRSVPKVDGRWLLVALILVNFLLSHGPLVTVEAVGLVLGIRLLSHRLAREGTCSGE